jgi:putative copper resistance protein D
MFEGAFMESVGKRWIQSVGLVAILILFSVIPVYPHDNGAPAMSHDHHHAVADHGDQWDGSPKGTAYSNFNHHLAGIFVILIGLSEIRYGFAARVLAFTRLLLPIFMVSVGVFLLIWSDHESWPLGSTFSQAFFTGDWETIQHKWFGIVAVVIGSIEWLRRTGHVMASWWKIPLPAFAIIGGLSLFLHSHGAHPSAHKIALHHAAMGVMAVTAGSSKFLSDWKASSVTKETSPWEIAWAALVLLIGIQLLIYSE